MTQPAPDILLRIEALLRAGRQHESRLLLLEYIKSNPASSRAWWLLSQAVVDPAQQIDCLERLLNLDPLNAEALERLEALRADQSDARPQAVFTETPSSFPEEEPSFNSAPSGSDFSTIPPEPPSLPSSPFPPKSPQTATQHAQKAPRKGLRALEAFLAFVFFSLIAAGCIFLWNQYQARAAADQAARTQATLSVAQVLAQLPTSTVMPTGTSTPIQATITSPALTPTAHLTATAIPSDQFRPLEGYYAPWFNLVDIQTSRLTSNKQLLGRPMLLYFCDTLTPECRDEVDAVKAIRQKYANQDPLILWVDSGETSAVVDSFQQGRQVNFPVLVDLDSTAKKLYQVQSVPVFFFIDPAGKIIHIEMGFLTYPQLFEQLKTLLP